MKNVNAAKSNLSMLESESTNYSSFKRNLCWFGRVCVGCLCKIQPWEAWSVTSWEHCVLCSVRIGETEMKWRLDELVGCLAGRNCWILRRWRLGVEVEYLAIVSCQRDLDISEYINKHWRNRCSFCCMCIYYSENSYSSFTRQ